jgi:hypothetical protein
LQVGMSTSRIAISGEFRRSAHRLEVVQLTAHLRP